MIMKCGHAAVQSSEGDPVCPLCFTTDPRALEVDREFHDGNLRGRQAECYACGRKTDSDTALAFFGFDKDSSTDVYYCGCDTKIE